MLAQSLLDLGNRQARGKADSRVTVDGPAKLDAEKTRHQVVSAQAQWSLSYRDPKLQLLSKSPQTK